MTPNFTAQSVPRGLQRATAVLHYDDYSLTVLGEGPLFHMQLQLAGAWRIKPLERVLTLFVLDELRRAGRPLHLRDVGRAWAIHNRRRGRRPWSEDRMLEYLFPALAVGVLRLEWDPEWGKP